MRILDWVALLMIALIVPLWACGDESFNEIPTTDKETVVVTGSAPNP